jgi:hypothetical protein
LRCNGTRRVTLKTLHGAFEFRLQKYQFADGMDVSFLDIRQGLPVQYISRGLQELSVYYSNRLSYREVAGLVERQCGKRVLSEQTIWQLVQQSALTLSWQVEWEVKPYLSTDCPVKVATEIDVYDTEVEEVLLFDDAISVKAQKPERQPTVAAVVENSDIASSQRVLTDVVVLQTAPGQYEYVSAPIDSDGSASLTLAQVVQAKVQQVYGQRSQPLPLVVVSDGASSIRKRWKQTFGDSVVVILDWYHLTKKLRDLMTMIARSKTDKQTHLKVLLAHLWRGHTQAAIGYLTHQVIPRHREKWQELLTYLDKHQHEMIDYERRQKAGKPIGSGRVEKAVDQVIGHRQKHKGTSWRPQGSRALGLLKVLELNGKWHQFWFSQQPA